MSPQVPPRTWTPTEDRRDLVEMIEQLSERAIGDSWHPQTANGSFLLARYGGRWGSILATDVATDLTTILDLARRHDVWPTLSSASEIEFISFADLRNRWRIIEGEFLVRDEEAVVHAQTRSGGGVYVREFACGSVELSTNVRPLTKSVYNAEWCLDCATWVTANAPAEIDWAALSPAGFHAL